MYGGLVAAGQFSDMHVATAGGLMKCLGRRFLFTGLADLHTESYVKAVL